MSSLVIYYENEPILGVNITFDVDGSREYDFFSSLYKFKVWVSLEYPSAELVEITDSNYEVLSKEGLI